MKPLTTSPSLRSFEIDKARAQVVAWFKKQGWLPFTFQQQAWQAYLDGASGLIHAATGYGKTYAAFLGPVIEALAQATAHQSKVTRSPAVSRKTAFPLTVLWVTPLRALARDLATALLHQAEGLQLNWTIEIRTGDTPASLRAKQKKKLPTVLITTPESLSLLLSYPETRLQMLPLSLVVVDEWHELMGSKRGVMLELVLAHLKQNCQNIRIWGLSATLGNTDQALQVLLGGGTRNGVLIEGVKPKAIEVQAVLPETVDRFPWAGHLGLNLLSKVLALIDQFNSTLLFTNTRSQTEIWYQAILNARPDLAGAIALHHGSLNRQQRREVEKLLQNGRLKCVVCTSSLDLGVDFTPVDHVLQIGSPKGIARLMQRAGRSGHQPQAISRITCVPTHAFQLVEIAAARDAMAKGFIESRTPIVMALDVLVQHLVTLALGNALRKNHILAEIRTTHAYQSLSREAFRWALDFITTGGPTLQAYPDYAKVINKQNMLTVENPAIARRHRMNIGTITSDASVIVKYAKGGVLGRVEESFAARLRAGDIFIFAGKSLEYRRMHHMTLYVRKAKHSKGSVPQWLGGRMPLSTRLGEAVRLKLAETRQVDNPQDVEMQTLAPILNLQKRWSRVPASEELLMETLTTRNGHHMFVFPFEGQLVHEGLAALCAYRLTRIKPITISIAVNDYGFELLSDQSLPLREALDNGLWSTKALFRDIMESLNTSEMARRQFRDIARIAGLVFQGYPGRQKGNRQVQASASLIYSVFERYDPDHRLLQQARQEVLERQLEFHRLKACLERISQRRLQWMHPSHPTPLAFPIMANRLRSHLSSEKLAQQLARMQLQLEKAAERTLSGAVSRNGRRGR